MGECVPSNSLSSIDFCKEHLQENVCVPFTHPLWPDWDASSKDIEVQRSFAEFLEARIVDELDSKSIPTFTRSSDCIKAYKAVLCLLNFPDCNEDETFTLCNSICEDYQSKCSLKKSNCESFDTDLSRCSCAIILSIGFTLLW